MTEAEPYHRMATVIDDGGVLRSALACHVCKRRKSKCDRTLPSCATCRKGGQTCEYPEGAQKPGPKTGMCNRAKKRKADEENIEESPHPGRSDNLTQGDTSPHIEVAPQLSPSKLRRHDQWSPSSVVKDVAGLSSPGSTVVTARSPANGEPRPHERSASLSQLIHPTHEPCNESNESQTARTVDERIDRVDSARRLIEEVCLAFQISYDVFTYLINAYFENMTAFTLFHRPTFEAKLLKISSRQEVRALLASMFTFSSRFRDRGSAGPLPGLPLPEYFHTIAARMTAEALEACADEIPSLHLLQAMTLTTFHQLVVGVRGKGWRALGNCIRMAYELQLHSIDSKRDNDADALSDQDSEKWIAEEEQRRVWWVLWEFDVFASTIRRLPTAIDWRQNDTWLPADDESWFSGTPTSSCPLAIEPQQRWKSLVGTWNRSGRAWFIVINSLMRNAQSVQAKANQRGTEGSATRSRSPTPNRESNSTAAISALQSIQAEMNIISDALLNATRALPKQLSYHGEFLSFRPSLHLAGGTTIASTRRQDADKYSIHIMTQLTRFMIHHHQVFHGNLGEAGPGAGAEAATATGANRNRASAQSHNRGTTPPNQNAWIRYIDAADEILSLIRNSAVDHPLYVNPMLANTIWLAAAAQIAARLFAPGCSKDKKGESQGKFDLLRLTFRAYCQFWNVSRNLMDKLEGLEGRLKGMAGVTGGMEKLDHQQTTAHAREGVEDRTVPSPAQPQPSQQDRGVASSTPLPPHLSFFGTHPATRLPPPANPLSSLYSSSSPISQGLSSTPGPVTTSMWPSAPMADTGALTLSDRIDSEFSVDGQWNMDQGMSDMMMMDWNEFGGLEELLTYGYDV